MSDNALHRNTIHYSKPGTLLRPKIIGRLLRLFLGILCLSVTWDLVSNSSISDLNNPSLWLLIGLGLLLITYVVNIGFGVSIGSWPRYLSVGLFAIAAVISFLIQDTILGTPLWLTTTSWLIYVYGHLGLSFLLAAILATPGCEMRAIPQLFGMAMSRDVTEHYCPAFIDNVDRWEHAKNENTEHEQESDVGGAESKDVVGNAGKILLLYGIPFAALQIAGNLGGFRVATLVPAISFLAISFVCFINIARCKRVHCYFLGPWCLATGVLLVLYSFRLIGFGADTWSLIVNTALIGGVCISMHMEMTWGKYFRKS